MATVKLSRGGATIAQTDVTVTGVTLPLFDGRAQITRTPFPTTTGIGNVTQTPASPYPVWDGYTYQGGDISIVADPTWGHVYLAAPPAGHHSPYWTGATPNLTQAQITTRRATGIGQTFWWSESITILASDNPGWGTFISLGYETVLQDQMALGVGGGGVSGSQWSFAQTCGLVTNGRGALQYAQALKPVVLGQRADWVVGARIAADNTGWVQVHYRPQGGSWAQVWSKTGIPTTVWNMSPSTIPSTVLDKEGLYFGWWDQTRTPAPTGSTRFRGLQRWATLADAVASLG